MPPGKRLAHDQLSQDASTGLACGLLRLRERRTDASRCGVAIDASSSGYGRFTERCDLQVARPLLDEFR
jgi:hypothetical protein